MGIAGTAQRNTYCNCLYDFWTTFETVDWPWTDQCTDLKGDSSLHGVCFGESDEYASWCKQKLLLFALDATRHSVGFLMCRSFSRTIKSLTHVARDKYRCCNFFYVVQLLFLVYITFDVASALISDVTTIIFSVTTNRSMKKIWSEVRALPAPHLKLSTVRSGLTFTASPVIFELFFNFFDWNLLPLYITISRQSLSISTHGWTFLEIWKDN